MKALHKICICLLLALAGLGVGGAEPKRVLFLHSFGRGFEPYHTTQGLLRTELASQMAEPVDFFEASVQSARFIGPEQESPLLEYLQTEFARQHLDLVVAIGGPAAQFVQRHRLQLFPETPMLFAIDQRLYNRTNLTAKDTAALSVSEPGTTVELILQVLPETTNVVVVMGNSAHERFWSAETRRELQPFTNRVSFVWLDQLPFSEMLKQSAALPPRSAILFPLLIIDAAGVPHLEEQAMLKLHEVANAPIFGIWVNQLGQGIVGGRLMDIEEYSRKAATAAARILHGENPGSIQLPPQRVGPPEFDWRELRRWGISEARLPPGSVVRFRQPGIWERYWWLVCGGVLFAAAEAALIIGLLVNRTKRRRGEAVATLIADLSSRFINLPADKVDLEIEAAQRRICECLGLDLSSLWQWSVDRPDDLVLTHVCRRVDGPPIPERMSAREYFPWCLQEVRAKRRVAFTSLEDAPQGAARDWEVFRHFDVKANLTIPLAAGEGPTLGAVSFNTMRAKRAWPEEVVEWLQVVAQIFGNALARKRADEELRESEARLSLAADAAAVGLWRLDLATNSFWLTKKTRELFAFAPDEHVTFDRFLNLVHPEDRELVRQKVHQVLESKGEVRVEYRILQPDGRVQWMHSNGRVHGSGSGQPDHLMGVTVDVTPRKRAEAAFKASEQRFRTLAESSLVGIYVLKDGKYQYVNPAMAHIFGYSPLEMIGMTPSQIVQPSDHATVGENIRRRISGEVQSLRYDVQGRHKDGSTRDVEVYGTRLEINGRPALVGTLIDITERKRVEDALRKTSTRLASAIDVAGLGFYEMGSDPGQIFVDERLRSLLGLTPQDTDRVQEFWIEHIHPDDRERVRDLSRKVLGGELPGATVEYRYLHPERGTLWFSHVSRAEEQDATGKTVRRLGVIRDITEQRQAELESQRLRGNLAHLTRVNTLGALSGSLAHELNQPLGIILSNAQAAQELLTQEPLDTTEVKAILGDIVKADRRAGEVIERLRALFKGGQASLQKLSLNAVIEEVLRLTRAELLGRGVTVIRGLAPDLPPVAGDRVQLQQLVLNLILNAADAMAANAPGTRRLHLRTTLHLDHVRASVRDEGEGLPADVERLFHPLYTTKPQGLGMGLAICRSIVGAHNGRLWAERHPERGAVFHFELPVAAGTSGQGQGASGGPEQPRPSPVTHDPPLPTIYERKS